MRLWSAVVIGWGVALVASCGSDPAEPPGCRLVGCYDGLICTRDICDLETGACRFEPLEEGADCGDGDVCNGLERCDGAGTCVEGEPPEVDDGDPCTADRCDPIRGPVHAPIAGCGLTGWTLLSAVGAPSPRTLHTAVWTGSEMIVWGGKVAGSPNVSGDGARYDPETDGWTPVSRNGAPAPRHSHSAVWTGSEMIVWGGFGASGYEVSGGRYDPATDTWQPISVIGAPGGRTFQRAVFTGEEMVVWGGLSGTTPLGDGARYDPSRDLWSPMAAAGAPIARLKHGMVATGPTVIVWGGTNTFDWLSSGAIYDLATNTWTGPTPTAGAPYIREEFAHAFIGEELLVWGGWDGGNFLDDGGRLDPAEGWAALPSRGAPGGRARMAFVAAGEAFVVWGGCGGAVCDAFYDDGAIYERDAFTPIASGELTARAGAASVWTGDEVIIWGGEGPGGALGDGARGSLEGLSR